MKEKELEYSKVQKLSIKINTPLETREDFSLAYTPGIAEVCRVIKEDPEESYNYTSKRNFLAVISDGSAVLGLGNIGAEASYPVMEGKAMIFKKFANIDAIPIVVEAKDDNELIKTILNISKSFSAINLEDIAAPRCFRIEKAVKEALNIPVMHDDQHGTAIVVLAALFNALKLTGKSKDVKIVINGAGAAGIAISSLLHKSGFSKLVVLDSKGTINSSREDLNEYKRALLDYVIDVKGNLEEVIEGAEVFIGVSKPNLLTIEMVKKMKEPIIFALSNPVPEIMPEVAYKGGAIVVGTGRSDFPNQINNALAFPGVFRAAMDMRCKITDELKIKAAEAIVEYHRNNLSKDKLLPSILDSSVHRYITEALKEFIRDGE